MEKKEDTQSITEQETSLELPYSHFTTAQKTRIVAIIAYVGLLSPFSSASYYPSIGVMADDLNVSLATMNTSVSVFLYVMAIFPLFWSNIAERYGRRNVYIASMTIYTAASVGCALSKNIGALLASRVIQASGSSSALGVGAASLADIFERHKRGTAMGLYFLGVLLGPPLAPVIGGAVSQHLGWRAVFWMLTIMAGISLISIIFFLPETHRRLVAQKHQIRQINIPEVPAWRDNNPIQTLLYVRNPRVLITVLHTSIVFGAYIAASNSNTFVMGNNYHLSETMTGITYLAMGFGDLLGSVTGGRFVDFVLTRERKMLASKNNADAGAKQVREEDIKVPAEIRIRYLWVSAFPFIASIIGYGWMAHKSTLPIASLLVIQAVCGFCLSWQLTATSNYLIDLYPTQSANITASVGCYRSVTSGVCTQILIIVKNKVGWGWLFTIFGGIVTLTFILTLPLSFGCRRRKILAFGRQTNS